MFKMEYTVKSYNGLYKDGEDNRYKVYTLSTKHGLVTALEPLENRCTLGKTEKLVTRDRKYCETLPKDRSLVYCQWIPVSQAV